jgi:glutamate racemase
LFVPLVEENWLEDPITLEVVEKYLQSLKDKQIDTLILGCTHYPLLINPIEKVMGKEVSLINSAKEVAVEVRNKLKEENIANISKKNPTYEFFVSDEPERFSQKAVMFLGRKIKKAKKV